MKQKNKHQRKRELKVIYDRSKDIDFKIDKSKEGEKFFLFWKDKRIGEYTGNGLPQRAITKFRENLYKKSQIYVFVKKDTPLKDFTLYPELSHWCSCGEIDLGTDVFARHVKRYHS